MESEWKANIATTGMGYFVPGTEDPISETVYCARLNPPLYGSDPDLFWVIETLTAGNRAGLLCARYVDDPTQGYPVVYVGAGTFPYGFSVFPDI